GNTGIYVTGSAVLDSITATGNSIGVNVEGAAAVQMSNALIYANANYGLMYQAASGSSLTVRNATIHGSQYGVYILDVSGVGTRSLTMSNSLVTSNTAYGIYKS